jgi:radical SAM superfamily enzyme YgiQ (UPF0313 family)
MVIREKNFLFIISPSVEHEQIRKTGNQMEKVEFVPPYGPLSIISYIRAHSSNSVQFNILDLKLFLNEYYLNDSFDKLTDFLSDYIKNYNPDYIGISTLFSICYKHLFWIEKAIIRSKTQALVIIGGALATGSYQEIFDNFPRIDIACYGEGEIPLLKLIDGFPLSVDDIDSPSLITRERLVKEKLIQPELLESLDDIPPYDFSFLDLKKYTGIQYQGKDNQQIFQQIDLITSRGCPFDCTFCSCHLMYGKKVRYHSVERIIQEIDRYIEMGVKVIRFYDENFFFDPNRAKSILKYLISKNMPDIKIEFPNGMMTARIDEDVAYLLKKAGLNVANLAVESGSDYVLKNIIHKPVDKNKVIRAVNALKKYDIDVRIYLVTGFPGENDLHRQESVDFIKSLEVDWTQVTIATPFKGSRLYDICMENNFLVDYDLFNISMKKCFIQTEDYSSEYIEYIAYRMNLELNFINNSNLLRKRYRKALEYFSDIIRKFPSHAFAHYCIYLCYSNLEQREKGEYHLNIFNEIINQDSFWMKYAKDFHLINSS